MDMSSDSRSPQARRPPLAQVLICTGCCCGRTEKGFPEVPVAQVKAGWKGGVNRTIQLTISGCLGPCDKANVILVITPRGLEWFGGLQSERPYQELVAWARWCHSVRILFPLPASVATYRFEWLAADTGGSSLPVAQPVSVDLAIKPG